ncbi:hypothetical protein FISHEDRAFT_51567 [Fistulina hepatica ATCC 64428]|uniref:BTB domain-containing protein n=1 Tax=Fistulina hepatica ATCC 64428 TaxID=1128425 RepID=A0A0D7A001_9AGAR|nr:hypothetical protein FISHEDRAFT_51567 [Fistulina hepatica ATCC 64428]
MTTNPSHILIARNSRGPNNPSASLIPAETHAAASGIFRSSGSPPWLIQECESDDIDTELSIGDDDKAIEIDPAFTQQCPLPGTVKIVVESTTFWTHEQVLYFASPFFEAALSGNWAETGRPPSMSSVITITQPPDVPDGRLSQAEPPQVELAPVDEQFIASDSESSNAPASESESDNDNDASEGGDSSPAPDPASVAAARDSSLAKLLSAEGRASRRSSKQRPRRLKHGITAVIVLKEEKASTFHDFLKFVYPHLECTITWNNVEGLFNISHKLCVPSLQRECSKFLLTHAAGRPIKALRIAEIFQEDEIFREASRFVLDNPGGWPEYELSTLSKETLLKLEKRRNWFLERLLKLGLTQIGREYQCCPTCPDPAACARALEEKWKQAYHSVFRFVGAAQPSMVYRYLRMLEGVSPPLTLTHLACQTSAKAFVVTLFDRMFSLGLRDPAPLARLGVAGAGVPGSAPPGPRRHFLYCTLKIEQSAPKPRRSREVT